MKVLKTIISLSLALFLITALVSCGGEPAVKEETMDIIVPWNATTTSMSAKGLTGMVTDLFNTQPGVNPASMTPEQREQFLRDNSYAQVVMTCQPIFPSLKTISGVKLSASISGLDLGFTMYGYTVVPDISKSRINRDGIYVLYEIKEDNKNIGYFEYYYNALTNRVTYREYVMLTILASQNNVGYYMNNAVLLFCLEDVPIKIEPNGSISLSANQWKGSSLESSQCFADFFFTGDHILEGQSEDLHNPRFERRVFTLKSSGGITVSFCQPWNSGRNIGVEWSTDDTLLNSIKTIMANAFGTPNEYAGDYIIDKDTKDYFTGKTAVEIIKILYPNADGNIIRGGWTNYDEFKSKSLYLNNVTGGSSNNCLKSDYTPYTYASNMWLSYFDLNHSLTKRAFWDTSFTFLNSESYENFGFEDLLGVEYDTESSDSIARSKVLNNFIPLCMDNTDSTVISSVVSQFNPFLAAPSI